MKLYQALPHTVIVDGHKYELRPSWDRVLEACDVASGDMPDRINYLVWLLFWDKPRDPVAAINAAYDVLIGHQTSDEPRVIDFEQDASLIIAAFRQAYNIDLLAMRDNRRFRWERNTWLHWQEFTALLSALPSNTRLSEIISIRTQPVPAATKYNGEQISRIMQAKARCRLHISEDEAKAQRERGLRKLVMSLRE